jgi:hypothetical protein
MSRQLQSRPFGKQEGASHSFILDEVSIDGFESLCGNPIDNRQLVK